MSFLGSFFDRTPAFDRFEGHPDGADALRLLAAEDWPGLLVLYDKLTPQSRMHLVQGLGMVHPLDIPLPSEADSPGIAAIIGGMQVDLAWRERGYGRGDEVTEDRFERMYARLQTAEHLLTSAAGRRGDDPCVQGWLIRCNTGLGGDPERAANLAAKLSANKARCLQAAHHHITYEQAKWFGSQPRMWAAIEQWTDPLPSPAWLGLIARGHIEDWLWLVAMRDDEREAARHEARMEDPDYFDELNALDDRFWDLLDAVGPIDPAELRFAHNQFATLFQLVYRLGRARPHVEAVGATPARWPQCYLASPSPMKGWNDLRRRCGLPLLRN
ncbi:MAG: hypothetical protein AAF919_08845 [Pseudomonadota bacterium]